MMSPMARLKAKNILLKSIKDLKAQATKQERLAKAATRRSQEARATNDAIPEGVDATSAMTADGSLVVTSIPKSQADEAGKAVAASAQRGSEGIRAAIATAKAAVKDLTPSDLLKRLSHIRVIGNILGSDRPGLRMPEYLLVSHIAERTAFAEVIDTAQRTLVPLVRQIDNLFGRGSKNGGITKVRFIGPESLKANPITGTFKDIAENPDLYDLSDAQKVFIRTLNTRNDELLNLVRTRYGVEFERFTPKDGGAFLPNVATGAKTEAHLLALGIKDSRQVSRGTTTHRIHQTARARMRADSNFKPELDVEKLLVGMDSAKAFASGSATFRTAAGGLTEREVVKMHGKRAIHMQDGTFAQVQHGLDMWFPNEEAILINRLREKSSDNKFFNFIDRSRGAVLTLDLSPILAVQGALRFLASPKRTMQAIATVGKDAVAHREFFNAFKRDHYIADFVANPESWTRFIRHSGRPAIAGARPEEMAINYIEMIGKGVGRKIGELNDAMFLATLRGAKTMFDDHVDSLMKVQDTSRMTERQLAEAIEDASAQAMDVIKDTIPIIDPQRLGLSTRQAQMRRLPFTSISFIRQPIVMEIKAAKAIMKGMTGHPLTQKEWLQLRTARNMAAMVFGIATMSSMWHAQQEGRPLQQGFTDAMPGGKHFMDLVFPNGSQLPIGGPHRSLINMFIPRLGRDEETLQDQLGKQVYDWAKSKITPVVGTTLENIAGKDFYGNEIRKDDAGFLENTWHTIEYEISGALPLTLQEITDARRLGEPYNTIVDDVIAQAAGGGLTEQSLLDNETRRIFPGLRFSDLEYGFLKDLVTGSEHIAEDMLARRRRTIENRPNSISTMFAEWDEIDEQLAEDFEGLVQHAGTMYKGINWNATNIRNAYFEATREASIKKTTLAERFGHEFSQDSNDPDERKAALAQWNGMNGDEDRYVVNGLFNRELFSADRNLLWNSWNGRPDIQQFVLAETNRTAIPERLLRILPRTTQQRYLASQQARADIMAQMLRDGRMVMR